MQFKKLITYFLLKEDLSSFDPYDVWKTKLGFKIKHFYNKNRDLAFLPSAMLFSLDLFFNKIFRNFYNKQEYPIVRAQAAIILLRIFKKNKNEDYLIFAKKNIDWLINNSSKGFNGLCWGLNFEWPVTNNLIYNSNEPFTTHTPYALESIHLFIKITGDNSYINYVKSIYNYYEKDVKQIVETENLLAVSYGTSPDRIITNAISYTLYAYSIFSKYIKNNSIKVKRQKLFNFIESKQLNNGSWLYTPDSDDTFIDCFHTCFIIKNLIKSNKIEPIENANKLITDGYNYLMDNFYDEDFGLFKRFSVSNKQSIIKFDLYDNAEVLNLFNLLEKRRDFNKLKNNIENNFINGTDVYSMIDIFNIKRNKNTLRWAVVPFLKAIN